jgi:eukaryotic-like serine/threonine-protein kinase
MFIHNRYLGQCDPNMLLDLEQRVDRFETAWRNGQHPQPSDFLPAGEIERRATLLELIHTDLECRLKAGETVQAEQYLQQYPELREEQAAMVELIEAASRLGQRYVRRLDKFELLEELGSGSFGIVYRARDTSLERIVAVKVSRGSLDVREELDRFFRETRSAAALRHPGIVTVHEAGQSGNRCYLVSELAAGPTLAQRLAMGRPSYGEAAEIVAGVAEALHYAHQQGVIHRDIKPSNILFNADGRPLVADFGLSRRTSDCTLTVEGQILGTPAYMPPEQAQGDAHRADARSDVYSLGVVFYEMLTGVAPFQGKGETMLQLIVEQEPLAPRRLDDGISRDLETICLKCLCKEPSGRYQTAADLAEELWRFLRGEPIRTRPPGALGRLARWCRRKPVVAGLLAALLLVTLAGFLGVTLAWRNAEINLAEARYQKEQAERNYHDARQAISEFSQIGSHPLMTRSPDGNPLRAELAATALKYYENFLARRADDPTLRVDVAESCLNLGNLYAAAPRNLPKAVAAYRKALSLWQELVQSQPKELRFQRSLSIACLSLGRIYCVEGRNNEALPLLKQACDILTALTTAEPNNARFLIDLTEIHQILGTHFNDAAHLKAAEQHAQQTLDLLGELLRKEPSSRTYAHQIIDVCHQLGHIKCERWEGAVAERWFEKARTLLIKLLKDTPSDIDLQYRFAENLHGIARAQDRSNRPVAALASFRANVLLWEELLSKQPVNAIYLGMVATCFHKIGTLEWETGHPKEAAPTLQKALELRQKLCQRYPESPKIRSDQSGTWYRLGEVLEDLKRFPEAEKAYRQALLYEQTVFTQQPGDANVRKRLRDRYESLARVCKILGRTAEAEKAAQEGKKPALAADKLRTAQTH